MSSSNGQCSFGVHVGNTSACLAVNRDGRCDVVANDAGDRVTPAVVGWTPDSQEVLTGQSAKQFSARNPTKVVLRGNKSLLGRPSDDKLVETLASASGRDSAKIFLNQPQPFYEIENDQGGRARKSSPKEVQTHILKYIHDIAVSHATSDVEEKSTVLTVPIDFTQTQRDEAAECAERAGFHVVQVISEPAAACLAYSLGQLDASVEHGHCLVFRAGATTLTCSVVLYHSGFLSVLASVEKQVGGEKFAKLVADYLADEFQRKYKVDPRESKRSRQKLQSHAEKVKHILSTLDTANCYIESFYDGIDFSMNVTRARFENEMSKVMSDFTSPVQEVLQQAGLTEEQIDKIILCGGTSKIPRLQKSLAGMLKSAELLSSLPPDEVIALGAATQSGNVVEKWDPEINRPQMKALNTAIVFSVTDGDTPPPTETETETQILIPRLCPIPVRKALNLDVKGPDATVNVFLQDDKGACQSLTKLTLSDLACADDKAKVKVHLTGHVHRDGGLHLTLSDKTSGNMDQVTLAAPSQQE